MNRSHVTHIMSNIRMSHGTHMSESCHTVSLYDSIRLIWIDDAWVMCVCVCVMSHLRMSHVTHIMSHIRMSHVTHMSESCHTVSLFNGNRLTWRDDEWVICVTRLIYTCDVTYPYVWRDIFICATRPLDFRTQRLFTGKYDTLQHTATHCNALQHTAKHCNSRRDSPYSLQW